MKKGLFLFAFLISISFLFSACSNENKKAQTTAATAENSKTTAETAVQNTAPSELYPAYVMEGSEKKWGYIDEKGVFVIKPEFESASDFQSNGLAQVIKNEKWGLIDKSGKFIADPQYTNIYDFSGKTAIASEGWDNYYLLDEKGQRIFNTVGTIDKFSCGMAVFSRRIDKDKTLLGYINEEGKIIIDAKYQEAFAFSKDRALVKVSEGHYGIIDKQGKILKEINAERITSFSDDVMTFLKIDGNSAHTLGYMSDDGKIIIDAAYSDAKEFEDGLAIVNASKEFDNKYGVINKKGEFIIPGEYAQITSLGAGLFAVPKAQEYTFNTTFMKKAIFDKTGKQLTDFKYYDVEKQKDGVICATDDKYTFLIDDKGNEISSIPKAEGIGTIKPCGRLYKVEVDNQLYYLSQDGRVVWKGDDTIKLGGGLEVKRRIFRPDRCMMIEYPEIAGLQDTKVQDKINALLKDKFVGDYKESNKADGNYTDVIDIRYGVERNKDLLLVSEDGYYYPIGAAHGQPSREDYHIDLKTGNLYDLKDLFKKDVKYVDKLTGIIKKKIEKLNKEEGGQIYSEDIGKLEEGSGFKATKGSLDIYFHPYAIAPYAAGFPEFDIGYDEIKDLINTDGDFWKSFERDASGQAKKQQNEVYPSDKAKIEEAIKGYENTIIEAVNKNDFSIVEPWLYPESSLYLSQKKLVEDLNRKKIKERLEGYTVEEIKTSDTGSFYRAYVTENIAIQYPGKDYETKQFMWVYSMKYAYENQRYQLTYIDKWEKK